MGQSRKWPLHLAYNILLKTSIYNRRGLSGPKYNFIVIPCNLFKKTKLTVVLVYLRFTLFLTTNNVCDESRNKSTKHTLYILGIVNSWYELV